MTLQKFLEPEDLIKSLQSRYATKMFDSTKKIDEKTWAKIEDMLVLSASSFGLQPWKFLVIKNTKTREQLKPVSWNQSQITDASHIVVFLGKTSIDEKYITDYISHIATTRGVSKADLQGYNDMMIQYLLKNRTQKEVEIWAAKQTYIALGNILTSAAVIGVDTCPIEGISHDDYQKILNVGDDYKVLCVCAFGYRSKDDKYSLAKKVRFDKNKIIQHI